jgi:hypothetical protein
MRSCVYFVDVAEITSGNEGKIIIYKSRAGWADCMYYPHRGGGRVEDTGKSRGGV